VRPDEPLSDIEPLLALRPSLAVLDGLTEALVLHGLDLRDNTDVARSLALLPRPLQRSGASVVLLDHVAKDTEARGRWAIGAQHKLAGVDVAYLLDVLEPFGRGRDGHVRILVQKDRPGFIRRYAVDKRCADLRLSSSDEGGVSYELAAPEERKVFRPTGLMEKVSRTVEEESGLSKRALRTAEGGKKDYLDLAIELLLAEGFIEPRKDEQAIRHTRKGRSGKPKTPPPWPVAEPWPDCDRPWCKNRGPVAPL
jgi:hypothetical protein